MNLPTAVLYCALQGVVKKGHVLEHPRLQEDMTGTIRGGMVGYCFSRTSRLVPIADTLRHEDDVIVKKFGGGDLDGSRRGHQY